MAPNRPEQDSSFGKALFIGRLQEEMVFQVGRLRDTTEKLLRLHGDDVGERHIHSIARLAYSSGGYTPRGRLAG